ncbi:hypothetical protein AMTR_s00105p00046400 [Amborella trichopoda]|uniref:Uncharacterized protein n=1 Tax=Amborella trichopoda TaxID=13333 RepID=W1NXM9_AMBTC|nr:hypothetical protein AMTR_s00105p00046400 [Amborella trichopoda]
MCYMYLDAARRSGGRGREQINTHVFICDADLLHVFSLVPRDLNFIDHTSDLGWKEDQRVCQIVVDPQLYLVTRYDIFHASERRPTPNAFKFFTGSPWLILSRVFVDFLVLGWDNLPRTLPMYFTNVLIANEGYFPTLICNSVDFQNKTVNSDLRHMVWDTPSKPMPHYLGVEDYDKMLESGYAFARQFKEDEPVLNKIDKRWGDPCSSWGDPNVLKPGPQAKRLGALVSKLLANGTLESRQCV